MLFNKKEMLFNGEKVLDININNSCLYLKALKFGWNYARVRVGHKYFYATINKNHDSAFFICYAREFGAPFDGSLECSLFIRNDSVLHRNFFERIKEISDAQKTCKKFKDILYF